MNTRGGASVRDNVKDTSAGKALALLDAFTGPRSVLGVTELAARANLPKSSAHRLLSTMIDSGYIQRAGDKYTLSTRSFEVGSRVRLMHANGLIERAMPYMSELFAQTRQTVHLAVPSGSDILYVEKLFGHDSVKVPTAVGSRRPAYATALGKSMLANLDPEECRRAIPSRFYRFTAFTIATPDLVERALDRTRQEGYATDFEESFLGVSCVAVPVLDARTRRPLAALSVSTAGTGRSVLRYRAMALRAAEQLASQLAGV